MSNDPVSPWLARGLYLFGFALAMTAAIDLFTTVWPMRPSDIAWRYGFLGLTAGYLQTPTLGLALMIGTAIWARNRTVLRLAGFVALVVSLLLMVAMGLFGLDVIQMRGLRAEEMQSAVMAGGMFQELKYFIAVLVLVFLGFGALKTAKATSSDWDTRKGRSPGIVSSAG